jgi:predicted ATPase
LRTGLDHACQARGGVIEVEGEPGVGKSRLLMEFLSSLPAAVRVASGQCITYGRQRPNVPVVELVRDLLDLGRDETEVPLDTSPDQALARASAHLGGYTLVALQLLEARLDAADYGRAQAEGEALREFAQQVSCPFVAAGALLVLAELELQAGRAQRSLPLFEQAQREFTAIEALRRAALVQAGAGRALSAIGECQAARQAFVEARRVFLDLGSQTAIAEVDALLATWPREH